MVALLGPKFLESVRPKLGYFSKRKAFSELDEKCIGKKAALELLRHEREKKATTTALRECLLDSFSLSNCNNKYRINRE